MPGYLQDLPKDYLSGDEVVVHAEDVTVKTPEAIFLVNRQHAFANMMKNTWGKVGIQSNLTSCFRDENGNELKGETLNASGKLKMDNGEDREFTLKTNRQYDNPVVGFFINHPEGKLQMLWPGDGKPHYITMKDGNYAISRDPVPAPTPVPRKPTTWERFKNLFPFARQPHVKAYDDAVKRYTPEQFRKMQEEYGKYQTFCKVGDDAFAAKEAKEAAAEAAQRKQAQQAQKEERARQEQQRKKEEADRKLSEKKEAENAKLLVKQEQAERKRQEAAEKQRAADKRKQLEKAPVSNKKARDAELKRMDEAENRKREERREKQQRDAMLGKNDVARKFFIEVNEATKKNPKLETVGKAAKMAMNSICNGVSENNRLGSDLRGVSRDGNRVLNCMATIIHFRILEKYPHADDSLFKRKGSSMIESKAFQKALHLDENADLSVNYMNDFLLTGGMNVMFQEITDEDGEPVNAAESIIKEQRYKFNTPAVNQQENHAPVQQKSAGFGKTK